jgi:succinate-acetate transporter protein
MTPLVALWSGLAIAVIGTVGLMVLPLRSWLKAWKPFTIVPLHAKMADFPLLKSLKSCSWLATRMVLVYWGIVALSWGFRAMLGWLNLRFIHVVLSVSVLILGIGAFIFKKKSRKWYGLVEIIVAWFTAVSISTRIVQGQLDLTTIMSLAGTIYIVSRGLDNIDYDDENAKGLPHTQTPVSVPAAE